MLKPDFLFKRGPGTLADVYISKTTMTMMELSGEHKGKGGVRKQ